MSLHQARLAAMRNNMKRHLVGKSYTEIHTELAIRADEQRRAFAEQSALQHSDASHNTAIQSTSLNRIERALNRCGTKLERLHSTFETFGWAVMILFTIRWVFDAFSRSST